MLMAVTRMFRNNWLLLLGNVYQRIDFSANIQMRILQHFLPNRSREVSTRERRCATEVFREAKYLRALWTWFKKSASEERLTKPLAAVLIAWTQAACSNQLPCTTSPGEALTSPHSPTQWPQITLYVKPC